jgi:hypothetical protein
MPLFEAIAAAAQEPPATTRWSAPPLREPRPAQPQPEPVTRVVVLAGEDSKLSVQLRLMGLVLDRLKGHGMAQLVLVDGATPPSARSARGAIVEVLRAGGCVLVWGVARDTLHALNRLLPQCIAITSRSASSLLSTGTSPLIAGSSQALERGAGELSKQMH